MSGMKAELVGGTVSEFAESVRSDEARATYAGVEAATNGLKTDWRANIGAAGLGPRLGNAVGSEMYPKGSRASLRAAGMVFPKGAKAEKIFEAFNQGITIVANGHTWNAIPSDQAGRGGRGIPTTPQEFEARTGIKLRFIADKRRSDVAYLIGSSVHARSGRGRRAPTKGRLAQGRAAADIVFFILVRSGTRTLKRILSFEDKAQLWADRIPDLIEEANPD